MIKFPYNAAPLAKTIHLEPGEYKIVLRLSADFNAISTMVLTLQNTAPSGVMDPLVGDVNFTLIPAAGGWDVQDTSDYGQITVVAPGDVMVSLIASPESLLNAYVDYIYIIRMSDATPWPTSTVGPGTPTPAPVTPTATQPAATPVATGTPYCQAQPTSGGLTPYTPTIPSEENWGFYSGFTNLTNNNGFDPYWYSNGVSANWGLGHNALPSVSISNAAGQDEGMAIPSPSIVHSGTLHTPFYVDLWANADFVPVGVTQYLELWVQDDTGYWFHPDNATVSHLTNAWYSLHFAVTAPGGSSGNIVALAFAASRSDDAAQHYVNVDEIYIYGNLELAAYCNGGFPPGVGNADEGTGTNGVVLNYPLDKPCPPEGMADIPNNFWGPILWALTLLFLQTTAPFPFHVAGTFVQAIRAFADAPFWRYTSVVMMLFDLRPILAMVGLLIALEIVRSLYSLWRIILKIIPMAG